MRGSITVSRLTVAYDRHAAVQDVDGCFEAGTLTAVVGPNGAGKSTLVKSIVGILKPASGRIARDGIAARDVAYLPQAAEVDRSFPITVATPSRWGPGPPPERCAASTPDVVAEARRGPGAVGLEGFGARRDRLAVGRPVPARAVRPPPAPGRAGDRARRALHGHRRPHHARPARPRAALARRAPHGDRRAARLRPGAGALPEHAAARASADRLGTDRRGPERRQPAAGPRHGGALGRRRLPTLEQERSA